MPDWDDFLPAADQWFVSYSVPPAATTVKLFAIGHTVELYLKATSTKLTKDISRAIKFGHKIKELWDDCKLLDPNFMPNYEIRDTVFNSDFMHKHGRDLTQNDQDHFLHNSELYYIAKHLPDLKYIGAPLKTITPDYSLAFIHPNDYWIMFLKEIRNYLRYPQGRLDWIKVYIDRKSIPTESAEFLTKLYN